MKNRRKRQRHAALPQNEAAAVAQEAAKEIRPDVPAEAVTNTPAEVVAEAMTEAAVTAAVEAALAEAEGAAGEPDATASPDAEPAAKDATEASDTGKATPAEAGEGDAGGGGTAQAESDAPAPEEKAESLLTQLVRGLAPAERVMLCAALIARLLPAQVPTAKEPPAPDPVADRERRLDALLSDPALMRALATRRAATLRRLRDTLPPTPVRGGTAAPPAHRKEKPRSIREAGIAARQYFQSK